jgi:hypothetical protein
MSPTRFAAAALVAALSLNPGFASAEDSIEDRLHFSGYGDIHYNSPETGTMDKAAPAEIDVHRFVLGWRYDFTSALRLDAEIDFEHSASEIELEYANLEYDLAPTVSLRVGSLLMPVGPLNEFHEPPTYYSVERPYVETTIMPTTWQEIGLGLVGRVGNGALGYRAYVVSGLQAFASEGEDNDGFTTLNGIRGGRRHGVEAPAEDLAGVARLEYATTTGLSLGASGYYGGADQGAALGSISVTILDADARFRRAGFDLRGVVYRTSVDGADVASTGQSLLLGETVVVGKEMLGWYGEAAYDFLRRDRPGSSGRGLILFARYERFDTNEEVPTGLSADPRADRKVITGGVSYMPIDKIAFKTDLEHWQDGTDADLDRFNLGAAFQF